MTRSTDYEQIVSIEALRVEALLTADVALLRDITAHDCIHVESGGIRRTRQDFLEGLEKGDYRFATFVIDENRIDIEGETAIVSGRYHNTILTPAGLAPVKHAYHVRIYARREGTWINILHQATAIPTG